ncbi:MAG: DUF4126 domain-containing protein [Cyanobacteria bacterium]|nr:DUF4126 domain-containing protein [Cyanobacteriota bacterium]MDW8200178.1 DUF4126 domain-containing protein [Cyanobacteriota bacterium SKYGB_h_bin112]
MIELLAALSAAAAVGVGRIALPLLLIGLMSGDNLWYEVPILNAIAPPIVIGVLVSWSLFELLASTQLLGQRILQFVQLGFSPIVGAIMGVAIVQATDIPSWLTSIIATVCALLALVMQLVQVGWFYRLRGLPLWVVLLQDMLCVALVIFAFQEPQQGGIVAMLLLWFALRSSVEWRRWYVEQADSHHRNQPRRYKQNPD